MSAAVTPVTNPAGDGGRNRLRFSHGTSDSSAAGVSLYDSCVKRLITPPPYSARQPAASVKLFRGCLDVRVELGPIPRRKSKRRLKTSGLG